MKPSRGISGLIAIRWVRRFASTVNPPSSASSPTSATVPWKNPAATKCISIAGKAVTGARWKWSSAAPGRWNRWSPRCVPTGEHYQLERLIDDAVGPRRFITRLLEFFSTLALALASIGLYGVMAFAVTQRQQEIGIRMAIGAQRSDILQMILHGGLKLVAIGVAVGLAGSLALTQMLQSQLYGITAHDPLTFAGIAVLLTAVAAAACLLPALRATRVDPMIALRAE